MHRFYSALFISFIVSGCGSKVPADKEMLAVFQSKKAHFEHLQTVLCSSNERRVVMMDPEWSEPQVSDNEKAKLYSIYREIGAKGVYYDGDCSFRIAVWSVGFGGDGDYKYYSYRPKAERTERARVVSTLDKVDRGSETVEFYLRPIVGDWYLAFDHWP